MSCHMAPGIPRTPLAWSMQVDVYSFSIMMVEILSNEQPFLGKDPIQVHIDR